MKNIERIAYRLTLLVMLVVILTIASSRTNAQFQPEDTGICSGASVTVPFTDLGATVFFCTIAEAYFSGLTNGTDATHYSPLTNVTRDQMSAFVTRTQDSALRRGSPRAALGQWATPSSIPAGALTTVGILPLFVASDGADLWVSNQQSNTVSRVRASDGKLLDTYGNAGMINPSGVLVARGHIYVSALDSIYIIDPKLASGSAGAVTFLANVNGVNAITTDGTSLWTADANGFVSKINPDTGVVQSFAHSHPNTIIYDGASIWFTDILNNTLVMLNSTGNLELQTISVGTGPGTPTFDGTNIWVPNSSSNSVTVVRVKDASGNALPPPPAANAPFVVATLTGNGLSGPVVATFDGQRILVTNPSGPSVSLWKAADFSRLGSAFAPAGNTTLGACSDGINFWIVLNPASGPGSLARF